MDCMQREEWETSVLKLRGLICPSCRQTPLAPIVDEQRQLENNYQRLFTPHFNETLFYWKLSQEHLDELAMIFGEAGIRATTLRYS